MEINYLTSEIYIKDEKSYYEDNEIKKHNWHHYYNELGWEKLHKGWISKLNKLNEHCYKNNSLFGALECGDDGDCLFHCIAQSLNSSKNSMYDSKDIRNKVAESISEQEFNDIITCYRCMKDMDDFDEDWDPYSIDTLDSFKK